MDNNFDFKNKEDGIYKKWLDAKYFSASVNKDKGKFSIIMPPPNITSKLHMGHSFQETIQDIIIRKKRMDGLEALWLPGTDHAAIATEAKVVEKLKTQGLTKEMIGRDAFDIEIKKWYDEYKGEIINQFKKMGFSCDWDRLAFTMDEKNSYAVRYAFHSLYKKGLIYRGNRMVNWCPTCKSSISDAEVDHKDNAGFFWHIRYAIEGSGEYLELATTRPETMLGDSAVAVNPKDERYAHLVGKRVLLPLVEKYIPIVADEYVDMEFGTGVVKITPAHDPNDLEVGKRHDLDVICVMNEDGSINENGGVYAGLDRFEARKKIVEDLEKSGNLVKIEPHMNSVGHCDRCKTVIEPLISLQWFVKMEELAKPAIEVVEKGEVKFVPDRFKKLYLNWLKNIRDWCISRQLWSGHKVPVWVCQDCKEDIVELTDPEVCPKCGSKHLVAETDTLDTWFSSALWPISTLGWPEKTPDLDYFYPTNVLVTAQEIIQLWVVRMVFSGLEYVGKIPFEHVVINGTVKDAEGRKMSKNLGNGVNPIEIIEKYGTDALRFSLFNGVSIDADTRFSEKKVELASAFINKIWNASKYTLMQVSELKDFSIDEKKCSLADKWFLEKLNELAESVDAKYLRFDLGGVASELYDFFWTTFCGYYIEISKAQIISGKNAENVKVVLHHGLVSLLKHLHPFIPFVTEEIYLNLPGCEESIMIQPSPVVRGSRNKAEKVEFEKVIEFIKAVRNLRKEKNLADNKKTDLLLEEDNKEILVNAEIIKKLAMIEKIDIVDLEKEERQVASITTEMGKAYLVVGEKIDAAKEIERLSQELAVYESEFNRCNKMLSNEGFVKKAPENMIKAEKEKMAKYENLILEIKEEIAKIK